MLEKKCDKKSERLEDRKVRKKKYNHFNDFFLSDFPTLLTYGLINDDGDVE